MNIEEQKESLKKQIEELNNQLQLLETTGRKLPVLNELYYYIDTDSNFCIRQDHYAGFGYDQINYDNLNYFTSEEQAINRIKQIQNYFKVMYYLELVNGDWKPSLNKEEYCIIMTYVDTVTVTTGYNLNLLKFKSEEAREEFRKYVADDEIRIFLNPMGVKTND